MKAVITAYDIVTPYGAGLDALWGGLISGKTAIGKLARFETGAFLSENAAIVGGLKYHEGDSLVIQMLNIIFRGAKLPEDSALVLATTKGEIDLLERYILRGEGSGDSCVFDRLLGKVSSLSGACGGAVIVSAACASASTALARAAGMVKAGRADSVLVVACDAVTEFVFSGFSSLMALDRNMARPFDRNREGLTLGEAAGYALVMSEERAIAQGREILGEILGWGLSDDTNHMTGPSRESEGMILAIKKALKMAETAKDSVRVISAHGTGTAYNDAMEMRAFRDVFGDLARPAYSVKGGVGHTMGAAGLLESLVAFRALHEGIAPPTINLKEPDDCARGWVSPESKPLDGAGTALVTNAGFSGINSALVLGVRG